MKSPLSFLPLSVFYDILKTYSFKEPYHKLYVIIVVSKQFPMIISLSPIRVLIDQIMYSTLCTGMEILAWFLVEGKYYSHT